MQDRTILAGVIERLEQAFLRLDRSEAEAVMQAQLAAAGPAGLADDLLIPVMERIGRGWELGSVSLSQVYMSGRLCESLVEGLAPPGGARRPQPRLAIATLDDYHLLGKRLVLSVVRAAGYDIVDYGRQEALGLAARAAADQIDVVLISVLMLPSALRVREVRAHLDALGSRAQLVVGGAPFRLDPELGHDVGASAIGRSAADALRIIQELAPAEVVG